MVPSGVPNMLRNGRIVTETQSDRKFGKPARRGGRVCVLCLLRVFVLQAAGLPIKELKQSYYMNMEAFFCIYTYSNSLTNKRSLVATQAKTGMFPKSKPVHPKLYTLNR